MLGTPRKLFDNAVPPYSPARAVVVDPQSGRRVSLLWGEFFSGPAQHVAVDADTGQEIRRMNVGGAGEARLAIRNGELWAIAAGSGQIGGVRISDGSQSVFASGLPSGILGGGEDRASDDNKTFCVLQQNSRNVALVNIETGETWTGQTSGNANSAQTTPSGNGVVAFQGNGLYHYPKQGGGLGSGTRITTYASHFGLGNLPDGRECVVLPSENTGRFPDNWIHWVALDGSGDVGQMFSPAGNWNASLHVSCFGTMAVVSVYGVNPHRVYVCDTGDFFSMGQLPEHVNLNSTSNDYWLGQPKAMASESAIVCGDGTDSFIIDLEVEEPEPDPDPEPDPEPEEPMSDLDNFMAAYADSEDSMTVQDVTDDPDPPAVIEKHGVVRDSDDNVICIHVCTPDGDLIRTLD